MGRPYSGGGILVTFAESNNQKMNIFFLQRRSMKHTRKNLQGITKKEIYFILSDNSGIAQDVDVLGKDQGSRSRSGDGRIRLNVKRGRNQSSVN